MHVGEEIKLRGTGAVVVTDPAGKAKAYEAGPGRTVTLEPTKVGTWTYAWENGRTGDFQVGVYIAGGISSRADGGGWGR